MIFMELSFLRPFHGLVFEWRECQLDYMIMIYNVYFNYYYSSDNEKHFILVFQKQPPEVFCKKRYS